MITVNDEKKTDKDRIMKEIEIFWKKIGEIENNITSNFRLLMRSHDLFFIIDNEITLNEINDCWNENKVILLHKGGLKSKNQLKNYRPVALSDTVGKIFYGIMNTKIKVICERKKY